jgi:hypothetical protein
LRAVKQCTVADAIIYWSLMGFWYKGCALPVPMLREYLLIRGLVDGWLPITIYNQRWLTSIIGISPNLDPILVNRLRLSSLAQFGLHCGREYRRLGAPFAANSSSGLLLRFTAGQPIVLPKEFSHTLLLASFCDQENETLQHLLVTCVFTHQVWYGI